MCSRRKYERVPMEDAPAARGRRLPLPVNGRDALAEDELDPLLVPEGVRPQEQIVGGAVAREELLGQRRPLVGRERLLADGHELAVVALGPKRLGAAGAGGTGAHDEDGRRGGHAASSSLIRIAAIGHAAAASSTAGSSDMPTRAVALPLASSSMMSGASSAQAPKPLHSDRSIWIRYMVSSLFWGWLRGWSNGTVEAAPGGREDDRPDRAGVQREGPRRRRVRAGGQTVERGQAENRVRRPVQPTPGLHPDPLAEREREDD